MGRRSFAQAVIRWRISVLFAAILGTWLFVGCSSPGQSANSTTNPIPVPMTTVPAIAIPTNTAVILSPTEDATVSWQEFKAGAPPGWFMDPEVAAEATRLVITESQHLTAIALTPTMGPPPYTPAPTRTLGVGIIKDTDCIRRLHDGSPHFPSCWDAYVNGK